MALEQLKPENFLRRDSTGPNCWPSKPSLHLGAHRLASTNRLDQRILGSSSANWLRSQCGGLVFDPIAPPPSISWSMRVSSGMIPTTHSYVLHPCLTVADGAWAPSFGKADSSGPPTVSEACNERTSDWRLLDPYLTRLERSALDRPAGDFRQSLGPADHLLRLSLTHEAQSVVRVVLAVNQALKILGH
jgi:hypothetical protein